MRKHCNNPCDLSYSGNTDTTTAIDQNLREVVIESEPEDDQCGIDEESGDTFSRALGNWNT